MQWGEECSGVSAVALVSVLQTLSSQMFAFKKRSPEFTNVGWLSYVDFNLISDFFALHKTLFSDF